MIVFRGAMSKECKKYVVKGSTKPAFVVGAVFSAIFLFPVIYAIHTWGVLAHLLLFPLAAFPWLCAAPPSKETQLLIFPLKIAVDEKENILYWKSSKLELARNVKDVRDVTDMGNCYIIRFVLGAQCTPFVCEKRLLCEGTLEAFEKVFEDNDIPIQRKEKGK